MEAKDKNESKTLPKLRGRMHQGLDGSRYHLMNLFVSKWREGDNNHHVWRNDKYPTQTAKEVTGLSR